MALHTSGDHAHKVSQARQKLRSIGAFAARGSDQKLSDSQEKHCQSLPTLARIGGGKGSAMARKLSIILAVVLAIFVAPREGNAQGGGGGGHGGWGGGGWEGGGGEGGGWHGGGWHGGGW